MLTKQIPAHLGNLLAVSFCPDGKTFASGGVDGAVNIWDTAEGRHLYVLRGHQGQVTSLAWIPNGSELAAGGSDGSVKLWAVPPPHQPMTFQAFSEPIRSFNWSKDDRLLTGLGDNTRTTWEHAASKAIQTNTVAENTREAISPDGRLKASAKRNEDVFVIHVEDIERQQIVCKLQVSAKEIEEHRRPSLIWAPDSSRLAAMIYHHVEVIEIPGGQRLFSWNGPAINVASWASDNTRLAIAGKRLSGSVMNCFTWCNAEHGRALSCPVPSLTSSANCRSCANWKKSRWSAKTIRCQEA